MLSLGVFSSILGLDSDIPHLTKIGAVAAKSTSNAVHVSIKFLKMSVLDRNYMPNRLWIHSSDWNDYIILDEFFFLNFLIAINFICSVVSDLWLNKKFSLIL